MASDITYFKNIWFSRYFWLHLALSDIRARYRRSFLGLVWALIHPLALTFLLSFVIANFFHAPVNNYAPFVFSGLILWEFLSSSIINGCTTFINAAGYIKQFPHPLLIYTLRNVIFCMVNLLCGFGGLVIWILLWKPSNFGMAWMSLLIAFPLLFFLAWALSTITAFIGARFHDFSQLTIIMLQALYYVSPILFLPKLFYSVNIGFLVEYNPIYYLLNLFRSPLLEGKFPLLNDYIVVLLTSVLLWVIAWIMILRNEKKIIFYL